MKTKEAWNASTRFRYVASHTGSASLDARGNDQADRRANQERLAAEGTKSTPFLQNEERFTAWITVMGSTWHVMGDFRRELRNWARAVQADEWSALRVEGRCVESNVAGTLELCRLVRANRSSRDLVFAILGLCEHLPVGELRVRTHTSGPDLSRWMCPSCCSSVPVSSRHILECPGARHIVSRAISRAEAQIRGGGKPGNRVCSPPAVRTQAILDAMDWNLAQDPIMPAYAAALASHPGRVAAADEELATELCRVVRGRTAGTAGLPKEKLYAMAMCFRLSLQLFDTPHCGPVFSEWWSDDSDGYALGSRGSPWARDWSGMLALCTPSAEQVDRTVSVAAVAVRALRPTRLVVLWPRGIAPPSPHARSWSCSPWVGVRAVVYENEAAVRLAPVRGLQALRSGEGISLTRRIKGWPATDVLHPRFDRPMFDNRLLPFMHGACRIETPEWAVSHPRSLAAKALVKLQGHDRFAGMLGVLSPDLEVAMAAVLEGTHAPSTNSLALVQKRLPKVILELFDGARRAWDSARGVKAAWEATMPAEVLFMDSDRRALRRHQRDRKVREVKYNREMKGRGDRRAFYEWRRELQVRGGFPRMRDLTRAQPDLRNVWSRQRTRMLRGGTTVANPAPPDFGGLSSPRRSARTTRPTLTMDQSFVSSGSDREYFGEAGARARARRRKRARTRTRGRMAARQRHNTVHRSLA